MSHVTFNFVMLLLLMALILQSFFFGCDQKSKKQNMGRIGRAKPVFFPLGLIFDWFSGMVFSTDLFLKKEGSDRFYCKGPK